MALDWNQEVSLSTILDLVRPKGKGDKGSSTYPTKTTMNLYQGDSSGSDVRKVALVGVLLAVLIAAFVKFGVLDQLSALSDKEGELAEQKALLYTMTTASEDYADMKETYDAYMAQYGTESVDAMAVLSMVEKQVKPRAQVSYIALADATLTLTLTDVSLDTVGEVANSLEGQPLVRAVNVTTATTQNTSGGNTVATLVVTLDVAREE